MLIDDRRSGQALEAAALGTLLALALLVRVTGIGAGAPFVYHPDEWAIVQPSLTMIRTFDWNPHWFDWPSLTIYVHLPVAIGVRLLTGASLEIPDGYGLDGLPLYDPSDSLPEQFPYHLYGRLLVAVLGVAAVGLVYLAARWHAGRGAGFAAASFLAVAELHVTHSRFLTPDVPSTTISAAVLLLTVIGLRKRRAGWLLAGGFAAGLAGGTKWNALATLLIPAVAWTALAIRDKIARKRLVMVGIGIALSSAAGLALATPAVLLDNRSVLATLADVRDHYFVIGHPGAEGTNNAAYYLEYLYSRGLGAGLFIFASAGLIAALIRRRTAELACIVFVVAYFVYTSASIVRFERNLLPLLPVLAFLSASFMVLVNDAIQWLLRPIAASRNWASMPTARAPSRYAGAAIVGLLMAAVAVPQLSAAWHGGLAMERPDTRTIAYEWIQRSLPTGTRIVREDHTPQLSGPLFQVGYVDSLVDRSIDWYQQHGYAFAVASSQRYERFFSGQYVEQQRAYEQLFQLPLAFEICPDALTRGPCIRVLALAAS